MRPCLKFITTACACLTLLTALPANASTLLITLTQTGPNVVGLVSGSVDTAAVPDSFSSKASGFVFGTFPLGGSAIGIGSSAQADVTAYYAGTLAGPASLGPDGYFSASSSSGNTVSLGTDHTGLGTIIFVPTGYVAGAALTGTSTWDGTTIAGLGLTPGEYTYSLAPNVKVNLDFDATAVVPEIATWAMMVLGLGLLGYGRRKRAQPFDGDTYSAFA